MRVLGCFSSVLFRKKWEFMAFSSPFNGCLGGVFCLRVGKGESGGLFDYFCGRGRNMGRLKIGSANFALPSLLFSFTWDSHIH